MENSGGAKLSSLKLDPAQKQAGGARRKVVAVAVVVIVVVAVVVAVAVALSGSGEDAHAAGAGSGAAPAAPTQPSASPAPAGGSDAVAAGGYVEARRSAKLLPGRDGVVAKVLVQLGQRVESDALLLELENEADRAEREMAAAELELARSRARGVRAGSRVEEVQAAHSQSNAEDAARQEARQNLERLESLQSSGAVTAAEVDRARQRGRAAEARYEAARARERMLRRGSLPTDVAAAQAQEERAEAALRRAEARLELTRLRAPFAGAIVSVDVEPGEVISLQSGREVMALADLTELWVRVDIPEGRISRVRLGATAEVVVDALGAGTRLEAEVVEIAPLADRQSNTVSVAVRVAAPPELMRPNMSARVFIETGSNP